MKDSQQTADTDKEQAKYIKANNERFSTLPLGGVKDV